MRMVVGTLMRNEVNLMLMMDTGKDHHVMMMTGLDAA